MLYAGLIVLICLWTGYNAFELVLLFMNAGPGDAAGLGGGASQLDKAFASGFFQGALLARLVMWSLPTIALGVLALLARPKAPAKPPAQNPDGTWR